MDLGELDEISEGDFVNESDNDSSKTIEREDVTGSVSGRIKYDREFLRQIGIQTAGIDRFKVAERGLLSLSRDNNVSSNTKGKRKTNSGPLMPHQNMQHIRAVGIGGMGNWQMVVPPPPQCNRAPSKGELTSTTSKGLGLPRADNAWTPDKLKRGHEPQAEQIDEDSISVAKKIRSTLNTLTPGNFGKVVSSFMKLNLENKDEYAFQITSAVYEDFEKAFYDAPSLCSIYARMVWTICKTPKGISRKIRKQILDKCQLEFQKCVGEADVKELERKLEETRNEQCRQQLKLDLEETKFINRRKSLINIRFIGELYNLQMLSPQIMVECIQSLLRDPNEGKIECLCKLLAAVGPRLELQLKSLEDLEKREQYVKYTPEKEWMCKIFSQLKEHSENKTFSSRIRYAVLDVVELWENSWNTQRNTKSPSTQEINSSKVQNIASLSHGDDMHRLSNKLSGNFQQKRSVWTKTGRDRFQTGIKNLETPVTGLPVFGPPSGVGLGRQRNQTASQSLQIESLCVVPPKLLPSPELPNRFQDLTITVVGNKPSNKRISNSSQDPGAYVDGDNNMLSVLSSHGEPSYIHSVTPTLSSMSLSETVLQNDHSESEYIAKTNENVKNIFQEYLVNEKFYVTLHRIQSRFPGEEINDFINALSRQVIQLSKKVERKCAGRLVRLLIENRNILKKTVIELMAHGVMKVLPDILKNWLMATIHLAQFVVEIFCEENNLNWLIQIGDKVIHSENDEGAAAWRELAVNSLNLLKARNSEKSVQRLFGETEEKNVMPIDEIPWLQDRVAYSLAYHMVNLFKPFVNSDLSEEMVQLLKEYSWDVNEKVTARALTEAICRLAWNSDVGAWEVERAKKLSTLMNGFNPRMFPIVWKQMEEHVKKRSIKKEKSEELWNLMYS